MAPPKDYSTFESIMHSIGFLFFAIGQILYAFVKLFIPSSYAPVKTVRGEIVLITGGGSGIGQLMAVKLAKLQATVVIWDVNVKGMEETVKMVKSQGGKIHSFKCDVTDKEEVYKVADSTRIQVGQVTILINNAGVVSGYTLLETPDHLIRRTFDVNAISHFWTTKAFLSKMIENNRGHIVTIASMAGLTGCNKLVDYCASKYAAVGFHESLRVELDALEKTGVKTTCICPFFIQSTGMFGDVNARFVPRLTPELVVDSVIKGILREDFFVLIPKMFRYTFWLKWLVPQEVVSVFLRDIVPDACPTPGSK